MLRIGITAGLVAGAAALVYAGLRSRWIRVQPEGEGELPTIAGYVREGAMAFLMREYQVLVPFVLIVAAFLAIANTGALRLQAATFALGAVASAAAGFVGMRTATAANSRTTQAASLGGMKQALAVAFSGGTVMGMTVVGLVLVGMPGILLSLVWYFGSESEVLATTVLPIVSGFSLGASSVALFARVGGGIFTKAADVGADLVGKIEAEIPEDDPRNPATIADNVGDNVGDVAGMGADLFESFVGSLLGSMILAISVAETAEVGLRLLAFPMILALAGVAASMLGILLVRAGGRGSAQRALNTGTFFAAGLSAVLSVPIAFFVLGEHRFHDGAAGPWALIVATVLGLAAGVAIGLLTELYTGTGRAPVRSIVRSAKTGPATIIITGIGVGMISSLFPLLVIAATVFVSHALAGLYGVAISALGMLVTLGIQLAVDAYGPIADNAGGLAVMAAYPREVREITDELDAVGNTTAAVGKGFAIGSAALTAIILFTSFREQTGAPQVDIMHVPVLVGVFIGAVIPYVFSALSMNAIGQAAFTMIEEVRRQLRERPGILDNQERPDYARCVDISTVSALKRMLLPGLIAALTPVFVGFLGGIDMLIGLLVGVTASGVVLALFMANAGGAWDNAKKMVESGEAGGRGSEAHKASVVGDTVGDPFKDTAGPSLNILIKLMAVVSLVIAPMLRAYWG